MRRQAVALCLLACCAAALASKTGKDYNYEDDYLKQTYDSYGYKGEEEAAKPKCGPKQFYELKEATTCIDVDSGECVKYDKDDCVVDEDGWCKQVEDTEWGCKYSYKSKGTQCRAANGLCDKADTCSGKSATCVDAVKDEGHVCEASDSICKKDAKCDGNSKKCPAGKQIANGTPCKGDGLYGEAYAEDGKVAMQSTVSVEIAKKHGWNVCHRCFEGKCAAFKFEWWSGKHKKEKKHGMKHGKKHGDDKEEEEKEAHKKHSHKDDDSSYDKSDKKYGHDDKDHKDKDSEGKGAKGDKYQEEEEEEEEEDKWFESKSDTEYAAKLEGYEDMIYCTKDDH